MSSQTLAPATKKKYTPLFRNLTETICAKKLKRNELLVVIFLLEKTLGFGKPKDQLTTGLIAYRTGIRKDRVKSAIQGVLASGLFERKTSPKFEYEYQIGQKFLDQHKGHFFAPALPKKRDAFRKTEIFSENREHTDLYPSNSLPSHKLLPTHQANAKIEDNNLEIAQRGSGQAVNTIQTQQTVPESNHVQTNQTSEYLGSNLSTQNNPQHTASETYSTEKSISDDNAIPHNWHLSLKLPPSLHPANQGTILNIFKQGTPQQALDTLTVFNDMERKGLVRHTPFLLKTLAYASQTGDLIMPNPQQTPTAKKITLPPVPNALDDSLTRYAEKYDFSAPRQAADFTYYYYRDLLRKERRERLAKANKPTAAPTASAPKSNVSHDQPSILNDSDLAFLI